MADVRAVALLRAVNVGGTTVLAMADLRRAMERAGFRDVATVGASGNVLFTAEGPASTLRGRVEATLADLGVKEAFVKSRRQLQDALDANPLKPTAQEQAHLLFLGGKPKPGAAGELQAMAQPEYRIAIVGDVCYYAYDRKWAGKRRTLPFEKVLGARGTARTTKVVQTLIAKLG